jgi:hypothetical protein
MNRTTLILGAILLLLVAAATGYLVLTEDRDADLCGTTADGEVICY